MIRVVKIGGNVVDNPEALARFVKAFAEMEGPKILVHGGGKEATRLSGALGIETKMIEGRRVTDRQTLDVVTEVYAGLINKRIVAMLQAEGCNAIGLSGADANMIKAKKRNPEPIDYGYVGDIDPAEVNAGVLKALLDSNLTPVFCAITHDGKGTLLNCNADSVASAVALGASRIGATDLIYCFEQPGVMLDIDNPDSLVTTLTPKGFAELKEKGVVSKGMIPKLTNSFAAIAGGINSVIIQHADAIGTEKGTKLLADD